MPIRASANGSLKEATTPIITKSIVPATRRQRHSPSLRTSAGTTVCRQTTESSSVVRVTENNGPDVAQTGIGEFISSLQTAYWSGKTTKFSLWRLTSFQTKNDELKLDCEIKKFPGINQIRESHLDRFQVRTKSSPDHDPVKIDGLVVMTLPAGLRRSLRECRRETRSVIARNGQCKPRVIKRKTPENHVKQVKSGVLSMSDTGFEPVTSTV